MSATTRLQVTIRRFTDDDYPAIVAIANAVYPDYPETVEEYRYNDEHRRPEYHFARFVAEADGQVVGVGASAHYVSMFHPRKFGIGSEVHPDRQGQGIGAALYDHLLTDLAPFEPILVRTQARSDQARSMRFLADRGFVEEMRSWESRLDVAAFDFTPFAGAVERVRQSGIDLTTYAALASDPDRDQKVFALDQELMRDVPSPDPYTPVSFDYYCDRVLNDPDLLPEGWFIAVDQATGEYAGMCQLWHSQGSADLYNGLTAVRRSYRRRGIALALKLESVAFARRLGRPTIKTWNESNNRAMLSINEAMGFVKQPAWINLVRLLRPGEAAAPA